jgi:hypothetical protein
MSMAPRPRAIHVHIESLVLRGFTHIDQAAMTTALQNALTHELNSTGTFGSSDLQRVHTAVTLPARCGMEHLGGALGQTLAAVIGEAGAPEVRRESSAGDAHG